MSTTIAIDLGGTNIRAARIEGYEIKQKIAVKCKANGRNTTSFNSFSTSFDN